MSDVIDAAFRQQWDLNVAEWAEWRALHDASSIEEMQFWQDVLARFTAAFA